MPIYTRGIKCFSEVEVDRIEWHSLMKYNLISHLSLLKAVLHTTLLFSEPVLALSIKLKLFHVLLDYVSDEWL